MPSSEWSFADAGSGGKKVMFNVCFALAVHRVASDRHLPLPSLLVVDTPTKNISADVNPELVTAFYREVYQLLTAGMADTQVVLIDSELVSPEAPDLDFAGILMDGTEAHPALLPGYEGP